MMSIKKLPQQCMHWSKECHIPCVAKTMSVKKLKGS